MAKLPSPSEVLIGDFYLLRFRSIYALVEIIGRKRKGLRYVWKIRLKESLWYSKNRTLPEGQTWGWFEYGYFVRKAYPSEIKAGKARKTKKMLAEEEKRKRTFKTGGCGKVICFEHGDSITVAFESFPTKFIKYRKEHGNFDKVLMAMSGCRRVEWIGTQEFYLRHAPPGSFDSLVNSLKQRYKWH